MNHGFMMILVEKESKYDCNNQRNENNDVLSSYMLKANESQNEAINVTIRGNQIKKADQITNQGYQTKE